MIIEQVMQSILGDESIQVDDVDTVMKDDGTDYPDQLPILALKNMVLFPGVVVPISVGRTRSLKALRQAQKDQQLVAVFTQRDEEIEDPSIDDLYYTGVVARVLKMARLADGSTTVLLQGRVRCRLQEMLTELPYMLGKLSIVPDIAVQDENKFKALMKSVRQHSEQIIELSQNIPAEAVMMLKNITSDGFLLNFLASNLNIELDERQGILDIDDLQERGERILKLLMHDLQMLQIRDQIDTKVRGDLEKQQRDYFLNQQLRTIQEELGQSEEGSEIEEMAQRAQAKDWPERVELRFEKEIRRLRRINPQSPEYSVQMNYLDTLLDLPWNDLTEEDIDLSEVQRILDRDHYGLEKVKDRILEHLAVLKLKGDMKAPILCLVGPPGVGKTSLGKSIAEALGREMVRMSLGGLHDESEIRGHRKTYIGAMPGRIIQSLRKVGASNPVFILDEIDKLGKDFRGDPSSALLEVLDPEQNNNFQDNYLDIEYDLSKVLFIATANSLSTLQPALRDRMEIIRLSGYSAPEKVAIAQKHLVSKQRKAHGVRAQQVRLGKKTIEAMIQRYTRESGVRSLDRKIAAVMRHVARKVAGDEPYSISIKPEDLRGILGPEMRIDELYTAQDIPGVAVGLAWTPVGGDILFIEASAHPGKGKINLTGNLGEVMKESASTALSYVKAHADKLHVDATWFDTHDIHIHVPEGAIPKDGPSAGITMLTALSSLITERPLYTHLAMSGEITLRGVVLPVGGIKEKILAAKRSGIETIILSRQNERHVEDILPEYLKGLDILYVDRMDEVLDLALVQ